MATIRVSNIEAKADVSSPTVDEKVKVTSSDGRVLVNIDGKTVGVTSIGINTTGNTFTINNNNITFLGGVVAPGISTFSTVIATSITGVSTAGITSVYIGTGTTAAPSISPTGDSNTGIFFPSPDTIAFAEGGAEGFRLDSSGNISIANGNLVFSTSGKGIDFSATANSSGTMTSELLSDYEEGTWTPTISGWTGTYSRQMGVYVKIGKIVYIQGEVITNSGGSHTSSFPGPAGLPFVTENNGSSYYGAWTAVGTISPGAGWCGAGPLDYNTGGTSFFPNKYGVNQGTGNLSSAEFGTTGGGMRFFAVYRAV